MSQNANLSQAKKAKHDEFYTQIHDIEREMNAYLEYDADVFRDKTILLPCDDPEWSQFTLYFAQNFSRLGLKKLISTSYAHQKPQQPTPYPSKRFQHELEQFELKQSNQRGKIFILTQDLIKNRRIDAKAFAWKYLEGNGDFRSPELKALRDEADIIITNPPFSLFREFIAWIIEVNKRFSIIGNMNAITYKEVFPLIQNNQIWLGSSIHSGDREFAVPDHYPLHATNTRIDEHGKKYIRVKGVRWFTNLEHGRRHQPLQLMSMADNLKFNKKLQGTHAYQQYDNYNAIEIPFTSAIPSDVDHIMGVPISFLDKYCPEQFEIIWTTDRGGDGFLNALKIVHPRHDAPVLKQKGIFKRIFIRHVSNTQPPQA